MNWGLVVNYLELYKERLNGTTNIVTASQICQNTANKLGKEHGWTKEVLLASELARNHWRDLEIQIEGIKETA